MDEATIRQELRDHLHSVQLFSDAVGVPMYQAERVEFLAELIRSCDSMITGLKPLCEDQPVVGPALLGVERAASYQWRMDDRAFA